MQYKTDAVEGFEAVYTMAAAFHRRRTERMEGQAGYFYTMMPLLYRCSFEKKRVT